MARMRAVPVVNLDGMNRTEQKHAAYLALMKLAGEIHDYTFEPLKLRLGKDWKTTYRPDFMVVLNDGTIEFHEVKGTGKEYRKAKVGWTDDARVKIKVAARLFPWMKFVGYTWGKSDSPQDREDF